MTIKVKVTPRAKKERIIPQDNGLKVYIRTPAISGRANQRLIEVLSRYYKVKKYNITIVRGLTNQNKLIKIDADN